MAAPGGVPERPKGTGCKPVGSAYGGSNAHARDLRVLGVDRPELLPGCGSDSLADRAELARLGRLELEAERGRVGDRVPHAAEGDVDLDRSESVDLERRVELVDERRDVRQ